LFVLAKLNDYICECKWKEIMDKNVGYHAGDLGKSETYFQQSGGRGTGHFGTGTYFVGDPKEIERYNMRDGKPAPKHVVDFTPYKLYRPKDSEQGFELHSVLSDINNYKYYLFDDETIDIINTYKKLKKYVNVEGIFSPDVYLLSSWKNNPKEFSDLVNELIDYVNHYNEEHYMNPDLLEPLNLDEYKDDNSYWNIEDYIETTLMKLFKEENFEKSLNHYEDTQKVNNRLSALFGSNYQKGLNAAKKVYDEYQSQGGWDGSYNKKWDSLSTIFMKALGYEGVDVRFLKGLDNTSYGSVIYDLRPETILEGLLEKIVHLDNGKWQVQSEKGRNMGTYDTEDEAKKRLQQVHYFKHINEDVEKEIKIQNNDNIIEDDKELNPPIDLDYFPNNMGINLCSVKKEKWIEQDDGQLKKIEIEFDPATPEELKLQESKQDRINLENKVGRELSDKFFELRNRLNPPQNDVYYWINKKPSELENALNSIEKSRKQKDMEAREGTDLIFEDDTWLVLKINTHEASKKYGKGTKWCISGEGDWKSRTTKYHNSKEVWDDYVDNHGANIWFFINKKDNHKYCVVECAVTLDGQTATGLEIYDDSNRMIIEIPNAPRTSVPTYSEMTSQLFNILGRFVDTDKIINLISYDPDQAMTHQDLRVDLDGEESRYFRFDRYGRVQEITKNDLDVIDESYESSDFKLGTAGYIKEDGTFIYVDEYHGEDEELSKKHYPEFSNTHPEEDTCIRLELDYEPNEIQFKKLEEIIDRYLDIEDYCKIEIWDGTPAFYRIYSIFEGACEDTDWNEKVGNWTGYKLVSIIKNFYSNSMKESLLEKLLLEKTRSELIAKSKKSDAYSKNNQHKGKNRWERRKYSKIATKVADYNKIDMDAFFRGDILDFIVAVQGETNNYEVLVTFEDILHELQNQIKGNKNKLEFKCVLRALINQFNKGAVYVSCSCPDWKYRQAYWSTKGQYNSGAPQPSNGKMIANPGDTKGAGCKHVNLVLANLDWIMKIASVINNYIYWARDNMEYQYGKLIFPKLFGMPYDKAIQLTLDMYDENGDLKPEYTQDKLRSDIDTINMSNMIGRERGQYKKKPQQSINPRYSDIHPKKEPPVKNELELELGDDKELVVDDETED